MARFGSLSSPEGLKEAFLHRDKYGLMPVSAEEWHNAGKGKYLDADIVRVHIDDARKGDVLPPGTPHAIYVRPGKDKIVAAVESRFSLDRFREDDSILMLCGSPEGRESVAETYEREGWGIVGGGLLRKAIWNGPPARGRLVRFRGGGRGLGGCSPQVNYGRFAVVNEKTPSWQFPWL